MERTGQPQSRTIPGRRTRIGECTERHPQAELERRAGSSNEQYGCCTPSELKAHLHAPDYPAIKLATGLDGFKYGMVGRPNIKSSPDSPATDGKTYCPPAGAGFADSLACPLGAGSWVDIVGISRPVEFTQPWARTGTGRQCERS